MLSFCICWPFFFSIQWGNIKFADDWIRTADFLPTGCQNRPLYQQRHNHCPICSFFICWSIGAFFIYLHSAEQKFAKWCRQLKCFKIASEVGFELTTSRSRVSSAYNHSHVFKRDISIRNSKIKISTQLQPPWSILLTTFLLQNLCQFSSFWVDRNEKWKNSNKKGDNESFHATPISNPFQKLRI